MYILRRSLFLILLSLLIASCVNRPKEINSFSDIGNITGKLHSNKATVFVHLPKSVPTLNGKVTVDERFVAELPNGSFARNGSFTKLTLSPGVHVIDMKFPKITGPNCEDLEIKLEKGTVYHLALVEGPSKPSLRNTLAHGFVYSIAHFRFLHPMDGIQLSRYEKYIEASGH
jgi:hypothetical protein